MDKEFEISGLGEVEKLGISGISEAIQIQIDKRLEFIEETIFEMTKKIFGTDNKLEIMRISEEGRYHFHINRTLTSNGNEEFLIYDTHTSTKLGWFYVMNEFDGVTVNTKISKVYYDKRVK